MEIQSHTPMTHDLLMPCQLSPFNLSYTNNTRVDIFAPLMTSTYTTTMLQIFYHILNISYDADY